MTPRLLKSLVVGGVIVMAGLGVRSALVHASAGQTVSASTRVVTGRVVLGDTNPVRRAHIVASGPVSASTDADPDGVFRLTGLLPGRYQIAATKSGFVQGTPAVLDVAADAAELTINVVMTRAGAVTGRVVDSMGAADVDDVVCLRGNGIKLEMLADDRGIFRFHTLRDGPYKVWIAGEDEANARPVTVVAGRTEDLQIVVPWNVSDRFPMPEAVAAPREEPPPPGTHAIRGRITSANSGLPLEGIVVRLAGVGSPQQTVRTSASGRYAFPDVPAGGYLVMVTGTPKYIGLSSGQKLPSDPPASVVVPPSQPVVEVNFDLPETKVLAGRVVDEFGDPAPDVTVVLVASAVGAGKLRFLPIAAPPGGLSQGVISNDLGEFRIRNVPPGSFFLMALSGPFASLAGGLTGPQVRSYGYALTFFPGTAIPGDAQPVDVDARTVPAPILFAMAPAEMGIVTGRVVDRSGAPAKGANVMLMQLHGGDLRMLVAARATTDPNGVFSIENVPAGSYVAQVGANGFASEVLTVPPRQTAQVELRLNPPSAIRGRLVFDGSADAALLKGTAIRAVPTDFVRGPAGSVVPPARINEDGTFEVSELIGFNALTFTVPAPWMLLSVLAGGVDMTDRPFEAGAGDVDGVVVRFVPHTTSVLCQVTDQTGKRVTSGFVLIVPQDAGKWAFPSRGVRGLRPGPTGDFTTTGLPPGVYRAVAFDRVPRPDWMSTEFLESVRGLGEGFTIGPGETVTVRLELRK